MSVTEKVRNQHDKTVEDISNTVRNFHKKGVKFRIRHGSTNSTRQTATKGQNFVDTGPLSNILDVEQARQTCLVEPNVPMDQLVKSTLAYGLVPLVVMEFPGITVGGGFSGTSAESSSFKHGVFHRTINYIEMVLANGYIVHCSEDENTDLFHGAAGAMGTFGVITLLEVQLRPVKPYVLTSYHPVTSVADAVVTMQKCTADTSIDYLDGILFSRNHGAIIVGRLSEVPQKNEPIRTFSKATDPWFYLHVQSLIHKQPHTTTTDTIPSPNTSSATTGAHSGPPAAHSPTSSPPSTPSPASSSTPSCTHGSSTKPKTPAPYPPHNTWLKISLSHSLRSNN
ncbi:MAG: hypothetical protein Q9226_008963 [Calogaya cf. arnoldii]